MYNLNNQGSIPSDLLTGPTRSDEVRLSHCGRSTICATTQQRTLRRTSTANSAIFVPTIKNRFVPLKNLGRFTVWNLKITYKMVIENMYIYIYTPGTQMTRVLIGKGLVLGGWPSKIEVIWVPGIYIYIIYILSSQNKTLHDLKGFSICEKMSGVLLIEFPPRFPIRTYRIDLQQGHTLQEINISHLGKRKIIFKMDFSGDMLVPRRVDLHSFERCS